MAICAFCPATAWDVLLERFERSSSRSTCCSRSVMSWLRRERSSPSAFLCGNTLTTMPRCERDGAYLVLEVLLALLLLTFREPSLVSLEPLNQEILFPQLGLELRLSSLRRCEPLLEGGMCHVRRESPATLLSLRSRELGIWHGHRSTANVISVAVRAFVFTGATHRARAP